MVVRRWPQTLAFMNSSAVSRILKVTWVLLASCFLQIGCGKVTYVDVSNEPEYQAMVGKTFKVVGPLLAYGIREHSAAPIEYVTLMPPPGIEGRTIVSLGSVPRDSTISIKAAQRATFIIYDPLRYRVSATIADMPATVPIYVDRFRGNEGSDGKTSLNAQIYLPVHGVP